MEGGGTLSERVAEVKGVLRRSGESLRRSWCCRRCAACWKSWEDVDEVVGMSRGGGGGGGGGVADILKWSWCGCRKEEWEMEWVNGKARSKRELPSANLNRQAKFYTPLGHRTAWLWMERAPKKQKCAPFIYNIMWRGWERRGRLIEAEGGCTEREGGKSRFSEPTRLAKQGGKWADFWVELKDN